MCYFLLYRIPGKNLPRDIDCSMQNECCFLSLKNSIKNLITDREEIAGSHG